MSKALLVLALATACAAASAAPFVPADDGAIVETLPSGGQRAEEREWRRQLAARPDDAALAVTLSQRFLERARALGEPRYAGLALGALAAWPEPATAPPAVALMHATLAQYRHDFDGAAATLERLLEREPQLAQGWLTLATVRRVQARYAPSDAACARLAALSAGGVHAAACAAENDALRGRFDSARAAFTLLAARRGGDAATRGWLLTSLAELEERAGRPAAAEAAWREALRAHASPYVATGFADFLIGRGRDAEALPLLEPLPRSDAVLLRQAIATRRGGAPEAAALAAEMRERLSLASQRPGETDGHAREQAMFALWVEGDAARALALAQRNLERQREPVDLLLAVRAAQAAGRADALQATRTLARELGLRDTRLEENA